MSNRQYTAPLVIQGRGPDEKVLKLLRIPSDDPEHDESWFRDMLFQHPDLLPAAEIESAFEDLKAVAKELTIGINSADLLFINSDGCIAIIETKLFRNREARREVICGFRGKAGRIPGLIRSAFRN